MLLTWMLKSPSSIRSPDTLMFLSMQFARSVRKAVVLVSGGVNI